MYSSPDINSAVKSRRMRWVGHEAHGKIANRRVLKNFSRKNQKERNNLEDTGVDRIIILQWIGITNRAAYEGMY
jgi:hypothetical protein